MEKMSLRSLVMRSINLLFGDGKMLATDYVIGTWMRVEVGLWLGLIRAVRKKDMNEKKNYQVHIKATGGNVFTRGCIEMRLVGVG
jgi:hypothetical protein